MCGEITFIIIKYDNLILHSIRVPQKISVADVVDTDHKHIFISDLKFVYTLF
jgi:hypothetical protein